MNRLFRKTADEQSNEILIVAKKQNINTAWDRLEKMQPQCGFTRLGLTCTDCFNGPCRINPFGTGEELTVCGYNKKDIQAKDLFTKASKGLVNLGLATNNPICIDTSFIGASDIADLLSGIGAKAKEIIEETETDNTQVVVDAGLGSLKAHMANILIVGEVDSTIVDELKQAENINPVTIGGNEGLGIAIAGNANTQELAILTGVVDAIIIGKGAMPNVARLAADNKITCIYAYSDNCESEAIAAAKTGLAKRSGFNCCVSSDVNQAVIKPELSAKDIPAKGVVYLGGEGNIHNTQDASFIKLAVALLKEGYAVATSGCAGASLARAGLCAPELEAKVWNFGSSYEVAQLFKIAEEAKKPFFAVMPEFVNTEALAIALAFAASGAKTYIGASYLNGLSSDDLGGLIMPLDDVDSLSFLN